jgi:hypothetical protein
MAASRSRKAPTREMIWTGASRLEAELSRSRVDSRFGCHRRRTCPLHRCASLTGRPHARTASRVRHDEAPMSERGVAMTPPRVRGPSRGPRRQCGEPRRADARPRPLGQHARRRRGPTGLLRAAIPDQHPDSQYKRKTERTSKRRRRRRSSESDAPAPRWRRERRFVRNVPHRTTRARASVAEKLVLVEEPIAACGFPARVAHRSFARPRVVEEIGLDVPTTRAAGVRRGEYPRPRPRARLRATPPRGRWSDRPPAAAGTRP